MVKYLQSLLADMHSVCLFSFEIITAVVLRIYRCVVRLKSTLVFKVLLASCLALSSTLKMEATCSSETSDGFQRTISEKAEPVWLRKENSVTCTSFRKRQRGAV
jgi:hypothetical protein